jgi:hypothetical protein
MIPIIFQNYIPDGPGWAGSVLVWAEGRNVFLERKDKERLHYHLDFHLPKIIGTRRMNWTERGIIFKSFDEQDKKYMMGPGHIDPERVLILGFENEELGAAVLWGECLFLSFHNITRGFKYGKTIEFISLG